MSDSERAGEDELLAIPRLAERVGVTPRVLRYWEEQGLISPTREHGKLRYSPRDVAIAALIRKLLEAGAGVEGVRMLKRLAERDIRRSSSAEDETALIEGGLADLVPAQGIPRGDGNGRGALPGREAAATAPAPRPATRPWGSRRNSGLKGRCPTPRDQGSLGPQSERNCQSLGSDTGADLKWKLVRREAWSVRHS